MADVTEHDCSPLDVMLADRRRPGRVDYQDAQLIALLRGAPASADPNAAEAVPKVRLADDLLLARGILIGLPISATIWAVIVFAIWLAT